MINIVLYQPEKPQNTGNIMRTCVAAGLVLHIIGPLTYSIEAKDVKRAGLDYIDRLKLFYYSSYEEFKKKNPNVKMVYITRYGKTTYSRYDFSDPCSNYFVMFGKESTGIPHDILKEDLSSCLRIPMVSDARSLNLSNCVALVSYEILRQQGFENLATNEEIKGSDFIYK